MKFSVYVETSLVSYLTAPQSQNIITVANQLVTQEWWKNHRCSNSKEIAPNQYPKRI